MTSMRVDCNESSNGNSMSSMSDPFLSKKNKKASRGLSNTAVRFTDFKYCIAFPLDFAISLLFLSKEK